jgi:gamma-glutamyl:cysteine ligase YbdK (ATP-grasp superfamily)
MSDGTPGLFEGYGIELEYMIVKSDSLAVMPIADVLLREATGGNNNEYDAGAIWWSNEIVRHVIELKNPEPAAALEKLDGLFRQQVSDINNRLQPHAARLMPTGAHPFMQPPHETVLWQYGNNEIYSAYDRIFSCKGHGWSNLQSTHLNLSFDGDEEFARLHRAIRLVLPIIPALCASTPVLDGKYTGICDSRMHKYCSNQKRIPSISGHIIPEEVAGQQEYEERILALMYRDIAPFDPEGILQHEWLNSRGAIARFERNAIEIRVIDTQESVHADIAVCALISEAVRALTEERWSDAGEQTGWDERELESIFLNTIKNGGRANVANARYLKCFGYSEQRSCTARQLWDFLFRRCISDSSPWRAHVSTIMQSGNLSERISSALGEAMTHEAILTVYHRLADCLDSGATFNPQRNSYLLKRQV